MFSINWIAAANVEIKGTDVNATTLHSMFELDTELKARLDFSKLDHETGDEQFFATQCVFAMRLATRGH